jgi:hypothetical protein
VKNEIEARLRKSGIDDSSTVLWLLRGPKTRIETLRPPPSRGNPGGSHGSVRDVHVGLIDALAQASWLRSKITTHRFPDAVRSLTAYDAHNVQSLARRLIIERFGFWREGSWRGRHFWPNPRAT